MSTELILVLIILTLAFFLSKVAFIGKTDAFKTKILFAIIYTVVAITFIIMVQIDVLSERTVDIIITSIYLALLSSLWLAIEYLLKRKFKNRKPKKEKLIKVKGITLLKGYPILLIISSIFGVVISILVLLLSGFDLNNLWVIFIILFFIILIVILALIVQNTKSKKYAKEKIILFNNNGYDIFDVTNQLSFSSEKLVNQKLMAKHLVALEMMVKENKSYCWAYYIVNYEPTIGKDDIHQAIMTQYLAILDANVQSDNLK
ncbi:MAG: hypothetical protein ACOX5X_04525 [Acholeplasmataceae bacterium]